MALLPMTDVIFRITPPEGVMPRGDVCRFGVLTASDRASSGGYDDLSGPAIEAFLEEALTSPWEVQRRIVADEQLAIETALVDLVDSEDCSVVVTTGGTGPAPRDVTPEATEAVCERMLPGFGEQMRAVSLKHVPTAVLSRQTAGIRGSSLILNLPGSPRSIREILDEVFAAVPYCVDLIGGPYITTDSAVVDSFRPPHARHE
ncbi:MAG: molybdopterin adenylyltransferase [Candidatus Thalassarchaeaceae archaeon]|jgi:molybdopterin adenylyltransferase|nr:molybdopterin adenylyltransferase [Candidatus Thalassarchaeaceae archaeon]MDP6703350.1 molybdopterin adenylyltransferase [Candidatus Thalassarchaeaceae archaeon]MDP7003402.1 molybdopterin adenylyltransferase [Candidatus Thalassarchaeaceae archaeon]